MKKQPSIVKENGKVVYYKRDKALGIDLTLAYGWFVSECLYLIEQRHPGEGASYVESHLNSLGYNLGQSKPDRYYRIQGKKACRRLARTLRKVRRRNGGYVLKEIKGAEVWNDYYYDFKDGFGNEKWEEKK